MYARIYSRVSTEEQAASGFSLGAQKERLEAFCVSQGWTVAGEYVDEGVSAKDLDRPRFRLMMAEAQPGDIILVYKLDRLTRSVRDLDDLLRTFEARGILFRSVTEQFDTTTATGRLFIRMIAEMAQWERETIAERTAFGKRRKAATGEWAGGPVPFGYIAVPSERTRAGRTLLQLVPDPERQHLVPMIFDRYLAGQGIRAIARWLNEELGARTQRGCIFHQLSVRRILTNPIYCGEIVHGRRLGRVTSRVRGSHPPLVSRERFERAQQLLSTRKTAPPRHATGQHPLAGVARCGVCGGRIDGQTRDRATGRRVYRCHRYATGMGCGQPALTGVSAAHVEANLIGEMERLLCEPPGLDRLMAEFDTEVSFGAAERGRLEQDLLEVRAAVQRWKRLFEKGHMEDEEYLREVAPHKERIRQLTARLSAAGPAPEPGTPAGPAPDPGAPAGLGPGAGAHSPPGPGGAPRPGTSDPPPPAALRDAWAALEPPERKALLQHFTRAFGVQILLFPDRRAEIRPLPSP